MHIKKFLEWMGLKAKLDSEIHQTPYVSERQVWWASLGENVGFEIGNVEQFACLHQARSIDYRRLYSNLGWLDEEDFRKVEAGFEKLYLRKIFPAISGGVAGNP